MRRGGGVAHLDRGRRCRATTSTRSQEETSNRDSETTDSEQSQMDASSSNGDTELGKKRRRFVETLKDETILAYLQPLPDDFVRRLPSCRGREAFCSFVDSNNECPVYQEDFLFVGLCTACFKPSLFCTVCKEFLHSRDQTELNNHLSTVDWGVPRRSSSRTLLQSIRVLHCTSHVEERRVCRSPITCNR